MLAPCGPWTQSLAPTGGKSEASVGPGVGLGLIAVQPGGDARVEEALVGAAVSVGAATSVGRATAFGADDGEAACPWQAASNRAKAMRIEIFFMRIAIVSHNRGLGCWQAARGRQSSPQGRPGHLKILYAFLPAIISWL